jgi:hypothetical protein
VNLTNVDTAKRLLIDLLTAQTGTGLPLAGVQVSYEDPAQQMRE